MKLSIIFILCALPMRILASSVDVTWTPNREIERYMSEARNGHPACLQAFDSASELVAVSDDYTWVLVVRRHRIHRGEERFNDSNEAPGDAPSAPVINYFNLDPNDGVKFWRKFVLPTDARPISLNFIGGDFRLVLDEPNGRRLSPKVGLIFSGKFRAGIFHRDGHRDQDIWMALRKLDEASRQEPNRVAGKD